MFFMPKLKWDHNKYGHSAMKIQISPLNFYPSVIWLAAAQYSYTPTLQTS